VQLGRISGNTKELPSSRFNVKSFGGLGHYSWKRGYAYGSVAGWAAVVTDRTTLHSKRFK